MYHLEWPILLDMIRTLYPIVVPGAALVSDTRIEEQVCVFPSSSARRYAKLPPT